MIRHKKAIEKLMPYVPGRPIEDVQKEYGLSDVVKLASNENPYGAPPKALKAAVSAFESIALYPDGACLNLKDAISKKFSVDKENIVTGAGADEIISMLAAAFLEDGDEVITAQVTFGQYAAAATAVGARLILTSMKNGCYDLGEILNSVSDKTKIIYIANPNNPTGTIVNDKAKIDFLKNVPKDVMVVFDEAYIEYVEDSLLTSSIDLTHKYENLVVLNTFSKIYGLASLRVGYGIASEYIINSIEKIRKPFNVSIPAQYAAIAALEDLDFVKQAHDKNILVKHFCYGKLKEMDISYIPSEANFIAVDSPGDSMEVFEFLMKKGYIVRPNAFGMNNKLRVTIGTMEQMIGFFEVLSKCI